MKYLLVFFASLLVHCAAFAQDTASTGLVPITRVLLLSPGISHEIPTGKAQSLYLNPYLAISAEWGYSSALGYHSEVIADPALALQYRLYYNRERRAEKGRRIARNSGNYLAGIYEVYFSKTAMWKEHVDEEDRRPVHVVGAIWGMQRHGAKRFSLDLHGGVGYLYTRGTAWDDDATRWKTVHKGDIAPMINVNIGFWLGKR
jgi:hypothetical protein